MAKIPIEVVFVYSDDWQGAYVDGRLAVEGHSVDDKDMLDMLDIKYRSIEADYEWLDERGRLPELLSDVKEEEQED